jgi:hypothetical protein
MPVRHAIRAWRIIEVSFVLSNNILGGTKLTEYQKEINLRVLQPMRSLP